MIDQTSSSRRSFLKTCAVSAGVAACGGLLDGGQLPANTIPYGPTLRDRLWMWGHETDTIQGSFGIPKGREISQADGCR
ncbi:MAG: twin-arginine translocation signal domain-containing protein, partial [Planctomycetia bacterium]|nr:twin-arginine translocation signal domain-containing protein [Planctomycetia bacterium]